MINYIEGDILSTNCNAIICELYEKNHYKQELSTKIMNNYSSISYTKFNKLHIFSKTPSPSIIGFPMENLDNTRYDRFRECIMDLHQYCENNNIKTLAIPYGIGSEIGEDWDKYSKLIFQLKMDVTIYYNGVQNVIIPLYNVNF